MSDDRPRYVPLEEGFFDAFECLDAEQGRELVLMIRDYAFDGVSPEGSGAALAVFMSIRPGIDKSFEVLRKKREAGSRRRQGGAEASKREQNGADASKAEQTRAEASKPEQNGANASIREQSGADIKDKGIGVDINPTVPKGTDGGSKGGDAPQTPRASHRFTPPTEEEAASYGDEYAQRKGYPPGSFDVERFMGHYESNGWQVGRAPMKDWRASIRNSVLDGWTISRDRASPAYQPSAAVLAAELRTETVTEL